MVVDTFQECGIAPHSLDGIPIAFRSFKRTTAEHLKGEIVLRSLKQLYGDQLGAPNGEIGHLKDFPFDDGNVKRPNFIGPHELLAKVDTAEPFTEVSRSVDRRLLSVEAHSQPNK